MLNSGGNDSGILLVPYDCSELIYIPKGTHTIIFDENYSMLFYNIFNGPIDNLPNTIANIKFGYYFNCMVDNLPNSIIFLFFGYNFNCPVNNLPKFLQYLSFGGMFNQSVDLLPNFITHLTFGGSFNKSVDKLPKSIEYLSFGSNFNQLLNNLPENLSQIIILNGEYDYTISNLPFGVKKIFVNENIVGKIKKIPWKCEIVTI
jgi:hypothetical protein